MKTKKLIYFSIMNIFLISSISIVYSSQMAQQNQLVNTNQTIIMQLAPIIDQTPINQIPLIPKAVTNQTPWPKTINYHWLYSPALGDLDQDGDLEIVIGGDAYVYAWHHDGNNVFTPKSPNTADSVPALGDIDGDGDLEIVIGSTDQKVYAWHHNGTTALEFSTGGEVRTSPALGDLDNDGDLEIVVGTRNNKVCAFNSSGNALPGWPITTGGEIYSSPALGDLDNDGDLEIVIGSNDRTLYAWHHNGDNVTGFPLIASPYTGIGSSPALADLDDDGDLEIATGAGQFYFTVWHHNGTQYWNSTLQGQDSRYSSPAIGDIDGDGDLEIVVGSQRVYPNNPSYVYAWHHDGSNVFTRISVGTDRLVQGSPALGDIDGDGDIEIIVGTSNLMGLPNSIYAWHHNRTPVSDWPQTIQEETTTSPALGDLDNDGDIEVVITSYTLGVYCKVYAWDCSGVFDPLNVPWRRFHHDNHGTGLAGYVAELKVCITSPTEGTYFPSNDVTVTWSAESPVGIDNYSVQIDNNGTWIPKGTSTNHTFLSLSQDQHKVDVRVFDLSGNNATDTANFTVDITPPIINIGYPGDGETMLIADVMVNWTGSDTIGINHYEVMIDNDNIWIDVGTDTDYTFNGLSDGDHSVDVIIFDNAGNNDTDYVNFTVQAPPTVDITSPIDDEVLSTSNIWVNWTGSDNTGIDHYEVMIDNNGTWIPKGTDTNHTFNDLSDGSHSVDIRAFDAAGNNATDYVNFTVQAPPTVTIISPLDGIVYNTSNIQLNWTGSDNTGIDHYEIRLDKESWIPVGTDISYAFNGLSNGNHSLYVRAFDAAGNNATDYVNFTVNVPKKADQPFLILLSFLQQEGIPILYIGVIGAVVAVVAVVGVVLWLRRRK